MMPLKLRWFSSWICVGVGFAIVLAGGSQRAEARPRYLKVFKSTYPDLMADGACVICHSGETKKVLNEYGMAVKDALGARDVKDEEAIKEALKKAEGKLPRKKP